MMKKNKWIVLTLACSLLGATPVLAVPVNGKSVNNQGPQMVQYADLDADIKAAAETAITQHGNGKSFQLEKAFKDEYFVGENKKIDRWLIENKDRSAIISVDASSGKMLTLSLTFDISEITGAYEPYSKAAQSAAKQLGRQSAVPFTTASLFISNIESNKQQFISFSTQDDQFIKLDLKTSKPLSYRLAFKEADMDRKIVGAAEQAVQSFGVKQPQPFTQFELHKNAGLAGEQEVWVLKRRVEVKESDRKKYNAIQRDHANKWFVVEFDAIVESKTGKIVSVTVTPKKENQKQVKLTQKQGIALAKPVAKKLFGVDLSSYKVKVDEAWGEYTFSRKEKESIVAKFNTSGNLVRMDWVVNK